MPLGQLVNNVYDGFLSHIIVYFEAVSKIKFIIQGFLRTLFRGRGCAHNSTADKIPYYLKIENLVKKQKSF